MLMERVWQDAHYALRMKRRSPAFTRVAWNSIARLSDLPLTTGGQLLPRPVPDLRLEVTPQRDAVHECSRDAYYLIPMLNGPSRP